MPCGGFPVISKLPDMKLAPSEVEEVVERNPAEPAARSAQPPRPAVRPAPRNRGWFAPIFWLSLLGAGAYLYWQQPELVSRVLTTITSYFKPPVATKPPPRTVPVVTSQVRQESMNLYLNGLGTVTAFYNVTLRSRVDGELMKVLFNEGHMVHEGDLLAQIDPRPFQVQLTEAEGQLKKDEAALKVAQLDLDRYTALRSSNSITQQQLDAQVALVKQSQGAIETDQGQIDNAKLQLTYARITAPITGRIGLRMVDPGNIVHANDPTGLAVIAQLQPIALVFTIPQDDIVRVQRRLTADSKLVVEAWDRDFTTKLATGSLMAVDNQVDPTTGTVKLKAIFPNEDNMLFPNQFVNARLLIDTLPKAIVVPSAAVQRGPNSTYVYVVKPDSTVDLRNVDIGPVEGDQTAIEKGLAINEVVVTDGVDKLLPGTKVAARGQRTTSGAPVEPAKELANRSGKGS